MRIAVRWRAGGGRCRRAPAPTAVHPGCEHDVSRMHARDPVVLTQMGDKNVAIRLDQRNLGIILDRKRQNIAEPVEIFSPYVGRKSLDLVPCPATVLRLVPGTGREAGNAE